MMKKMTMVMLMLAGAWSLAIAEESTPVGKTGFHRLSDIHPVGTIWKLLDANPLLKRQEWWGWRQKLEEKGLVFTVVYTGDSVINTAGGLKRGSAYLGNLDLTLTVDTKALGLWENGTFFVYGLYNFGDDLATGKYVGDAQGVSNIEAPRLFKLFELWYEHAFLDDKISARAGLYNVNSEFNTSDYAGLFHNSSFGMEPAFSLNTSVSAFPLSAPAFRLKLDPTEQVTILGAVVNGDPGDQETNPHGVNIAFNKKRGQLLVFEGQWHGDVPLPGLGVLPGTFKLGGWNNNKVNEDLLAVDDNGNPDRYAANYGLYAGLDQMIFREQDDQGLGVFVQYGQAPGDRNVYTRYWGGGINYIGLLPNRDEDTFGIAFNRLTTGSQYRETGDFDKAEEVLELTYQIQLTKAIVLQPDFQWVRNPNHDPALRDAKVVTIRTKVSF